VACDGGADVGPEDDSDGDGILNRDEGWGTGLNSDGDEWEDWLDLDSDGDGIADATEVGDAEPDTPPRDSDGDGAPDFIDTDSDGDGRDDADDLGSDGEPLDADADGTPDYLDDDDDDDGIRDSLESFANDVDSDADGIPNRLDTDSDGDGVPDAIEGELDTDSDGARDYLDLDSDDDGLPDAEEDRDGDGAVGACAVPAAGTCESDRLSADGDGDGIPDLVESVAGSDPGDASSGIPAEDFYTVRRAAGRRGRRNASQRFGGSLLWWAAPCARVHRRRFVLRPLWTMVQLECDAPPPAKYRGAAQARGRLARRGATRAGAASGGRSTGSAGHDRGGAGVVCARCRPLGADPRANRGDRRRSRRVA
jgi:hypothetical protein